MKFSLVHLRDIHPETKAICAKSFTNIIDVDNVEELSYLKTTTDYSNLDDPQMNIVGILIGVFKEGWYDDNGVKKFGRHRLADNLEQVDVIYYDFDKGTSHLKVIEATKRLGCAFAIYASKNHLVQKETDKRPLERYHLFIPLTNPITNHETYKHVWNAVATKCGFTRYAFRKDNPVPDVNDHLVMDAQVCDSTRFTAICKSVLFSTPEGTPFLDPTTMIMESDKKNAWDIVAKSKQRLASMKFSHNGTPLDRFMKYSKVKHYLDELTSNRVNKIFALAGSMKFFGVSEGEAYDIISPRVPRDKTWTDKKIKQTIHDNYKKG